ncbi:uncharacterized protein LOC144151753 isoform X1 [Haemaphysalis longicornis]
MDGARFGLTKPGPCRRQQHSVQGHGPKNRRALPRPHVVDAPGQDHARPLRPTRQLRAERSPGTRADLPADPRPHSCSAPLLRHAARRHGGHRRRSSFGTSRVPTPIPTPPLELLRHGGLRVRLWPAVHCGEPRGGVRVRHQLGGGDVLGDQGVHAGPAGALRLRPEPAPTPGGAATAHPLRAPAHQPRRPITACRTGHLFVRDSWSSQSSRDGPGARGTGLSAEELLAMSTLSAGDPSWKWGGCSAHVRRGMRLARRFLDVREVETDQRALMNLHNNRAGRKAVKFTLLTECKCHGVSGSCSLKTCWKRLPPFSHVGDYLVERYRRAKRTLPYYGRSRAALDPNRRRPVHLKLHEKHLRPPTAARAATTGSPSSRRRASSKTTSGALFDDPTDSSYELPWADIVVQPKPRDLVFLEDSPNYCVRDAERGSAGTAGRLCNVTSPGPDNCRFLCCGRGYETRYRTRTNQCHCKFHWCCFVRCDTCAEKVRENTCK